MSVCDNCIHRRTSPQTQWEPEEEWCSVDSDNFQTEDGCYKFEEGEYYE